jgi:hypothetical protein
MFKEGKRVPWRYVYAHRVVAIKKYGDIPEDHEVNHIDGDKHNNHPANLEIVTKSENCQHATHVLGMNRGENHGRALFAEDDIRDIRRRVAAGELRKDLAEEYGAHPTTITHIVKRRTWRHV